MRPFTQRLLIALVTGIVLVPSGLVTATPASAATDPEPGICDVLPWWPGC